jgi:demethylspheroidene O-methyltransferase
MVDLPAPGRSPAFRLRGWTTRLIAHPGFQEWASRFPLTRRLSRRDGAALFDLVQGFVQSQALFALVDLRILQRLMDAPQTAAALARQTNLPEPRMQILLQAGAAMTLLKRKRNGTFALARRGAALIGVPGLEQMILHHRALYRDLEDPIALLQGRTETEMAAFWPYVLGAQGDVPPATVARYSALMAQSQMLVAQDTLATVSFRDTRHLLDVGGGTGIFLAEVAKAHPDLHLGLFDLPDVIDAAHARLTANGLSDRATLDSGSFRTDPLPNGADTISLIRVLYDHDDDTVRALLANIHKTLPPKGRLVISEPMSGGACPDPITDVYFAFYTMTMGTGCTRSAARIGTLCKEAGFTAIRSPRPRRSYVTSVITAVKPE